MAFPDRWPCLQTATARGLPFEHFSFCYKLPCPIHSAFFCGMGGIPAKFRSTQFLKKRYDSGVVCDFSASSRIP